MNMQLYVADNTSGKEDLNLTKPVCNIQVSC